MGEGQTSMCYLNLANARTPMFETCQFKAWHLASHKLSLVTNCLQSLTPNTMHNFAFAKMSYYVDDNIVLCSEVSIRTANCFQKYFYSFCHGVEKWLSIVHSRTRHLAQSVMSQYVSSPHLLMSHHLFWTSSTLSPERDIIYGRPQNNNVAVTIASVTHS